MFLKILRNITPPIFPRFLGFIISFFHKKLGYIFDGNSEIFEAAIVGVKKYGEWGVGQSTIFMSNRADIVVAIDSDQLWIEKLKNQVNASVRLDYVNVGPIGAWGRPLDYSKRSQFRVYLNQLFSYNIDYDLILIDGRFRVACFLTCLLNCKPSTKIIFDDYVDRPYYKIIEEFLKPTKVNNRQALFIIPPNLPIMEISIMLDKFEYVLD